MKSLQFHINTIVCGGCVVGVEMALSNEKQLSNIHVDVTEQTLYVDCADDYDINNIPSLLGDVGHNAVLQQHSQENAHRSIAYYLVLGLIATLTGGTLMLLHSLPFLPFVMFPALCAGIAIPGIVIGGYWIFYNAYISLFKQKHLTMDVLFALSLTLIIVSSLASFFIPVLGLPMLCHTGLMIVGFRNLGKFLTQHMIQSVNRSTQQFIPFSKHYKETQTKQDLSKDALIKGHIIQVAQNEFIPVDGVIVQGTAFIDNKRINGELIPQQCTTDAPVSCGARIESGTVTIRVDKPYSESVYAQTQELIKQAKSKPSSLQDTANVIISYYLPVMVGTATLAALGIALFNPMTAFVTFIGILVGACPCVLGVIAPLSLKIAIDKAKRHNVLITDPIALDMLPEVKMFVFDKTGTLTDISVDTVTSLSPEFDEAQLKSIAYALEKDSTHPIAEAVCRQFDASTELTLTDVRNKRIYRQGQHEESTFYIGGPQLLADRKITLPDTMVSDSSCIYICKEQTCIGYISLKETVRPQGIDFINVMKKKGKQIVLLTGSTSPLPKELKSLFTQSHMNQSPQDKLMFIDMRQNENCCVAMIGDGDNDEAALTKSNVKISFSDADFLAKKQAHIILPKSNPFSYLLGTYRLSVRTQTHIKHALYLCLGLGICSVVMNIGMVAVMAMAMNPAFMAAFMFGQVALVLLSVCSAKWSSSTSMYTTQANLRATVATTTPNNANIVVTNSVTPLSTPHSDPVPSVPTP